ncbi:MAG: glycoside hydrolase family 31 protein [Clostridia bacterium]|nr:glycoside hydrolase family 31 protein [Clostridia bacterium]
MQKRITALFLLLCVLVGVFGCSTGGNGDDTTTTGGSGETTTTESTEPVGPVKPENFLAFAENGVSEFQIVCSASASDAVKNSCQDLVDAIYQATGATLTVVDDLTSAKTEHEILVGDQYRAETKDVMDAGGLGDADFAIAIENNKIVIVGGSDAGTITAVTYFINKVMFIDEELKQVCIAADINVLYDSDAPKSMVVTSHDENYLEFTIGVGSEEETFCRLSYTGNSGWRIQTKNNLSAEFNDIGASQRLSLSLGEDPVLNLEAMAYAESNGVVTVTASDGSRVELTTGVFEMNFYTPTNSLASTVTSISSNAGGSSIAGKLLDSEAIYGTGERFNTVNQRGKKIEMFTKDIWSRSDASYMVIPLLCSSRGSGVFVNLYEHMTVDIGNAEKNTWNAVVTGASMDCYIFATDQMADVIYGYSALSGFAEMPEEWTYGMLVCRYSPDFSTKGGVYTMVEKMEEYDLPWTGIIVEGWSAYTSSKHEDLKEICDYIHSLGKKVLVYMRVGNAGRAQDGFMSEYLLSQTLPDGTLNTNLPDTTAGTNNPDVGNSSSRTHVYLDITNPEAVEWFFNDYWDMLTNEIGVDGAKIDFCETLPENYELNYYNEDIPTSGSHHWYPTAFCALFYDMVSSKPDGGMCFTRGGGIGSQRSPYMWAGDQAREFSSLQYQLTALLSSGMSGVPFMSYDMSGYQYGNASQVLADEAKVFVRGTAFTAFTISMQTHGKVRRSYDFAEQGDVVTTNIYRAYTKLHEVLTPYITEYSELACTTGMPLARHLVLHWQDDANVYDINDQYMFGDAFMIAPELKGGTTRNIYLPEGTWKDLNTGSVYEIGNGSYKITKADGTTESGTYGSEGCWLEGYKVPMSMLPVFYNMTEWNGSETAEGLLDAIEEIFAHLKTLRYNYE